MSLEGRHAIVTGGGRGIGRAVAKALVASGANVTVIGRTETDLQAAVTSGDAHHYQVADVVDEAAIASAFAAAVRANGPFDILVANAGAAESAPFLKSDSALFQRMLNVNLMGVVHAARAALPEMIARSHGRIIMIASMAGLKGYAYVTAYTAAKHAVVGFAKALALETAMHGVTVNAVCPGYTETGLISTSIDKIVSKTGRSREDALADMLGGSPLHRLIKPEEVAAACVWLASDAAAAITGTSIPVAGGET